MSTNCQGHILILTLMLLFVSSNILLKQLYQNTYHARWLVGLHTQLLLQAEARQQIDAEIRKRKAKPWPQDQIFFPIHATADTPHGRLSLGAFYQRLPEPGIHTIHSRP